MTGYLIIEITLEISAFQFLVNLRLFKVRIKCSQISQRVVAITTLFLD